MTKTWLSCPWPRLQSIHRALVPEQRPSLRCQSPRYSDVPSMRFVDLSTSRDMGSDLHWVYLTQLCDAFRLSLCLLTFYSALIRLALFHASPSIGFEPSEVFPSHSPPEPLDPDCPSCPWYEHRGARPSTTSSTRYRNFRGLSVREIRSRPEQFYPLGQADPLLTFSPPGNVSHSLDTMLPQRLLLWAFPHTVTSKLAVVRVGSIEF